LIAIAASQAAAPQPPASRPERPVPQSVSGSAGPAEAPPAKPPQLLSGSISNDDYPSAAVLAGEQGSVAVLLSVDTAGRVADCEIASSSNSATLDLTACRLIVERFKFAPARDGRGRAVGAQLTQRVTWRLPDSSGGPFASYAFIATAELNAGQVTTCRQESGGRPATEVPPAICLTIFDTPLRWATARQGVTRLTQLVAFSVSGSPRPAARKEWGAVLVRADADLVIGPDGRVAGCTGANHQVAPDAMWLRAPDGCSLSGGEGKPAFEPATNTQPRAGHFTVATYAVRPIPAER
jgi:TonB family protein